jgi:hypothetical protein
MGVLINPSPRDTRRCTRKGLEGIAYIQEVYLSGAELWRQTWAHLLLYHLLAMRLNQG